MLDRTESYLSFVSKDSLSPVKRLPYEAAFRAEALRLAGLGGVGLRRE
jgi:hypothetical protein